MNQCGIGSFTLLVGLIKVEYALNWSIDCLC